MSRFTAPPALQPGDTIGIVTPSWPAHVLLRDKYLHGLREIERLGFRVAEGELTAEASNQGHRSGTPEQRAGEINRLFADPDINAIVTTIGGTNSSSLVPFLDFELIAANPKVFCGYSDVTSLHLAINRFAGLRTFYGAAVVPSFGEWPRTDEVTADSFLDATLRHVAGPRELVPPKRWSNHFRDALTDAWKAEPRRWKDSPGWRTVHPGKAEGPLLALNLNTLCANAGTRLMPEFDGAILCIEDMATSPADAERRFRHLAALGVFEQIAGLVWGKIESFRPEEGSPSVEDLLLEAIRAELGSEPPFPVVTGFDCCHTVPMLTLGQGVLACLDASSEHARITLLEPAVQA